MFDIFMGFWCTLFDCYLNRLERVRNTLTFYSFFLFSVMLLIFKNKNKIIDTTYVPRFERRTDMAHGHVLDVHRVLVRPHRPGQPHAGLLAP